MALTGPQEEVDRVTARFHAQYRMRPQQDGKSYTVDHTTFVYLLGPGLRMRYIFPHDTKADTLAAGLREVAEP